VRARRGEIAGSAVDQTGLPTLDQTGGGKKPLASVYAARQHGCMARVEFTPNLQRHLSCPVRTAPGATVRAVLDGVFAEQGLLRSYILDDQGRVRRHVTIFVNGERIADRTGLADPVGNDDEIFVFQALSGG
jgi:hypothetical protein